MAEAHLPPTPFQSLRHERHDRRLDGAVELLAVGRGVVEAILLPVDIVAVVGEPGVRRHPLPQGVLLIEEPGQFVARGDVGLGAQPERPLAHRAVGVEQVGRELRQRLLLAIPVRRHRPGELLVADIRALQLGCERHILFAEEFARVAETLQARRQIRPRGRSATRRAPSVARRTA